jgi:hypothetical protein
LAKSSRPFARGPATCNRALPSVENVAKAIADPAICLVAGFIFQRLLTLLGLWFSIV